MARRFVPLDQDGKPVLPGHLREMAGLLLCGASLFGLLALASFRMAPLGEPTGNLCGVLGDRLAFLLHLLFGYASFLLLAFLACWGALLVAGRGGGGAGARVVGVLGLTAAVAILLSLHLDLQQPLALATNAAPSGPGGTLGAFLGPRILRAMGPLGARLILLLLAGLALLLATDFFFLLALRRGFEGQGRSRLLRLGGRLLRTTWRLLGRAGAWLSPPSRRPEPDPAGEGAAAAALAPAPAAFPGPEESAPEAEEANPDPAPRPVREEARRPGGGEKPRRRPVRPRGGTEEDEARGRFLLPPLSLLQEIPAQVAVDQRELDQKTQAIERKLASFRISAQVVGLSQGPAVTLFELSLAEGVRVNQITAREDDLAMALAARSLRVVAPIPGKGTVGVEIPNSSREMVVVRDLVQRVPRKDGRRVLPLFLGKDVMGDPVISDLADMPHLLVAGATGSGKSVCLNSILLSLMMTRTPDEVGFILVDPKTVEFTPYTGIPFLMTPIVMDMTKVPGVLQWAVDEMERRYAFLSAANVRNIKAYNQLGESRLRKAMGEEFDAGPRPTPRRLPYVVAVIDEFGDLMATAAKDVEGLIMRLAQKSRAVGLHVIMATQHPSREVVTGIIKANLPTRISFKVTSSIYSRVVLDQTGAEKLLGNGDMLFLPPGSSSLRRAQGVYVSDAEIEAVANHWREQAAPEYVPDLLNPSSPASRREGDEADRDANYYEAVRIVLAEQRGAATLLQRALKVGYTRASRYIELMAEDGIVGRHVGSKSREVLMTLAQWEDLQKSREAWLKARPGGAAASQAAG